ncbi:Cof-type HAD-IIB family hydrolase [Flagellimonas sp. HMM57]|uniref:HAD family hydrolase n=1 Tax=unclassified Flagellimonas TaxID=2644544 RepID=UPI0013D7222E|nr:MULTISPECIES: HAD family hydrolase [unclassified Flagellimonas]UII76408.1 Cof-type HAD-IIB family hydrolase [Flagellimonas sp. HMM57]
MDLSNIKMVVSDMDGTLLNSDHEVSDRFFEIHEKLKKRDIKFVAASGRQYHSIIEKLSPIKDDIIVIAENGALVKQQEEELLVTPLVKTHRQSLLTKVNEIEGAHAMLCGKYMSYFDGKSVSFLDQLKEYYSSFEIHDNYSTVTDEILKIAVYHPISAETFIYPEMMSLEHEIKVKVSGLNWVDLNHVDANKGYALQHVLDTYGLATDEVLVFGDYNNDLEMLQVADYSFAMANAHPNVKKVASFETTSNNEFGVERILEKLL